MNGGIYPARKMKRLAPLQIFGRLPQTEVMWNQRYVPILSGIFDLAVVLSLFLFWSPESGGFWWWVRGVPVALFLYMGIGSLKRGFFASDTEIARMVAGEYDAKD